MKALRGWGEVATVDEVASFASVVMLNSNDRFHDRTVMALEKEEEYFKNSNTSFKLKEHQEIIMTT